jgi:histone H3/H4
MRRKTTLKVATNQEAGNKDSTEKKEDAKVEEVKVEEATPPSAPLPETSITKSTRTKKKLRRPVLSDTIPAIPVASFHRLAREMAQDCKSDLRWEAEALEALQVAAEAFMVEKFQKAKDTSNVFSRKTVSVELLRA